MLEALDLDLPQKEREIATVMAPYIEASQSLAHVYTSFQELGDTSYELVREDPRLLQSALEQTYTSLSPGLDGLVTRWINQSIKTAQKLATIKQAYENSPYECFQRLFVNRTNGTIFAKQAVVEWHPDRMHITIPSNDFVSVTMFSQITRGFEAAPLSNSYQLRNKSLAWKVVFESSKKSTEQTKKGLSAEYAYLGFFPPQFTETYTKFLRATKEQRNDMIMNPVTRIELFTYLQALQTSEVIGGVVQGNVGTGRGTGHLVAHQLHSLTQKQIDESMRTEIQQRIVEHQWEMICAEAIARYGHASNLETTTVALLTGIIQQIGFSQFASELGFPSRGAMVKALLSPYDAAGSYYQLRPHKNEHLPIGDLAVQLNYSQDQRLDFLHGDAKLEVFDQDIKIEPIIYIGSPTHIPAYNITIMPNDLLFNLHIEPKLTEEKELIPEAIASYTDGYAVAQTSLQAIADWIIQSQELLGLPDFVTPKAVSIATNARFVRALTRLGFTIIEQLPEARIASNIRNQAYLYSFRRRIQDLPSHIGTKSREEPCLLAVMPLDAFLARYGTVSTQ